MCKQWSTQTFYCTVSMVLQASWPIAIESSPSHTRTAQHPLTNLLQVNMWTYNKLAYWQIMMNEKNHQLVINVSLSRNLIYRYFVTVLITQHKVVEILRCWHNLMIIIDFAVQAMPINVLGRCMIFPGVSAFILVLYKYCCRLIHSKSITALTIPWMHFLIHQFHI